MRTGHRVIHRTRGTLEPERVINDINTAIIQGKKTIIGVPKEAFSDFRERYEPTLKEGMEAGFVDEFGNVNIAKIAREVLPSIEHLFREMPSLMGVFGEACSRYNPICIDERMSVGLYLDDPAPYRVVVFDVISQEDDGSMVFWASDTIDQLGIAGPNISFAQTSDLSAAALCPALATAEEEGFVVKSLNGYWKFKRDDVLAWERAVGYLPNILAYSVSHVFEQEYSFSGEEVLDGRLKDSGLKQEIVSAAWAEAEGHGVTRDMLSQFYARRGPRNGDPEAKLDSELDRMVTQKMLLFVVPALRSRGVKINEVWREIPKYFAFEREPTYFDAKKGRERASGWYAKLVSGVVGRTFLAQDPEPGMNLETGLGELKKVPAGAAEGTEAVLYDIGVSEGRVAAVHGFESRIFEAYLPVRGIAFNLGIDGKSLSVFRPGEGGRGRYDKSRMVAQLRLSDDIVTRLELYLSIGDEITKDAVTLGMKDRPSSAS